MKKIIALLLILVFSSSMLFSCKEKDDTPIKVGFLAGPTGIGMAKMIKDYGGVDADEQYSFTKYTAPDKAMVDLDAGIIDVACVSTEIAAKFYNNGSDIQVLAINCLNSLCFLANDNVTLESFEDLRGKTIYTSMQGTPKLILKALLDRYNIDATIAHTIGEGDGAVTINSPDQIAPVILQNKADIILAPVHVAYNALANPNAKHKIVFDLDSLWNSVYPNPMAMGCIVARKEFIDEHPESIKNFLSEYRASINYMADTANNETAAQYVIDATILPNLGPAKNAILKLKDGIRYIGDDQMKDMLIQIYGVYGLNVIGGKLPDDGFYYHE